MKLLIIGGTRFLGRHLVEAGLARSHEITVFNRGRLSSAEIPGVESVHGDRHRDLGRLSGRQWDAAIDTCGYLPQSLSLSARALSGSVGLYVFVSSISAYADFSEPDFDETAPTAKLSAEQRTQAESVDLAGDITAPVLGEAYGALKALCEQAAEKEMPGRVLNVRPGLIVGSYDHTDRFSYWVIRTVDGGEVLAPGDPERFVQLIDARDLADWILLAAENHQSGTFNATGKPFEMTMGMMLAEIRDTTAVDASFTWVTEEFLEAENVEPWTELPLYLPESDRSVSGFLSANVDKALATGLNFRQLSQTVREVLAWRQKQDRPLRAGLDRSRERRLLEKWREQVH